MLVRLKILKSFRNYIGEVPVDYAEGQICYMVEEMASKFVKEGNAEYVGNKMEASSYRNKKAKCPNNKMH
jgi:hypothetical protein